MTTALQLITDALGLTDAVGIDATLTDDEAQDGLRAFNRMLASWSTQDLAVYGQANQTFNTVIGTGTYTIGTGGTWSAVRPVRINQPAYSIINGETFPCYPMTQEEYNLIAVKAQTQDFPDRYLYVNEYPLGLVTLWPVPSAVTPVTFSIDRVLTALSTINTTLSFPPGYEEAFLYNLALRLAPSFGRPIAEYPEVVQIAKTSLGAIKSANKKTRVMRCDPAYSDGSGYGYGPYDWMRG